MSLYDAEISYLINISAPNSKPKPIQNQYRNNINVTLY